MEGNKTEEVTLFIDNTIEVLRQIGEEPEAVLAVVEASPDCHMLLTGLQTLEGQAHEVRTGEDLLILAKTIDDLIGQMPALATYVQGATGDELRQITTQLHTATASTLESEYVRERAEVMPVVIHRCAHEIAMLLVEDEGPDQMGAQGRDNDRGEHER